MFQFFPRLRYFSFLFKFASALALLVLSDILFFDKSVGSTLGLFTLAWAVTVAAALPKTGKQRGAQAALACAIALSFVMMDMPSPLAAWLFWVAISSAVLLAWVNFHSASQLALRLVVQGVMGLGKIASDAIHLMRLPRPRLRSSALTLATIFGLPLTGAVIFITLFANANPLVELALSWIPLPSWDWLSPGRCTFWCVMATLLWPTLRPSRTALKLKFAGAGKPLNLPGVSIHSTILSLALFNLIFAIENGLDAVFLWSGARLPQGITLADYAHRGAYPLIVTALLAGLFVLATARPDSDIGRNLWVRRLVVAWIAQNLILVASSIIRTMDYIDVYMLTELRIAALLWMGLVAVGLILICWRMIAGLPLSWLTNGAALAAAIILGSVSIVDLGEVAAQWNVIHAREAGGHGQPLDLAYMRNLGASALVPLATLETKKLEPGFRERVIYVGAKVAANVLKDQGAPYGWTWRNSRRVHAVRALLGDKPREAVKAPFGRAFDGTPNPYVGPLTVPASQ